MKTLSLVIFTLSVQAALGAYLVLYTAGHSSWPSLAALFLLCAVGLAFSLFHLGSPGRAPLALLNLRSSWLSREILFALVFSALLLLNLGQAWAGTALPPWMFALTCLGGLLLLYTMSRAYTLPGLPVWKPAAVGLAFTSAAVLTGGLLAMLLLSAQSSLPRPSAAAILALVLVWMPLDLFLAWRASQAAAFSLSTHLRRGALHQPGQAQPHLQRLHGALLPLGFSAAALTLLPAAAPIQTGLLGLALGLVVVGQAANRLRFYREGLGRRL